MNEGSEPSDVEVEWENRVLCSDESCIGTIGSDGRCRECGRPYEGPLADLKEPAKPNEAVADASEEASADPSVKDNLGEGDLISDANDEWERRTLCPDESCIGVIGPDGHCKECGRPL